MTIAIIASDEALSLAPNDCSCSERRSLKWIVSPASNNCSAFSGGASFYPHPRLRLLALADGYYVAFVPSYPGRVVVLDAAAVALLQNRPSAPISSDFEAQQVWATLIKAGLLVNKDSPAPTVRSDPPTLAAWLHLTNACNLRCGYCYVQKNRVVMSTTTARAAVDRLMVSALRHGLTHVVIKYAGGEPLLALSTLAAAHRRAQEQAAACGLMLRGSVLSNGTLLSLEAAYLLRDLDLDLMISLDGLGTVHDAQRPTVGERASFSQVRAGIENALTVGLRPTISITVTAQNLGGLPELVEWLLEVGLPFGINFYRASSGGAAEAWRLEEERLIAGMRAAYAAIARRPPRWSLLASLLDHADLSSCHSHSCAAGHHYLAIDCQGRVAACQMNLDQPVTTIEADDPLSVIRADGSLRNIAVDDKAICRQCDWRYWCGGGCPLAIYQATGRYDAPSPFCRVYRELFPEVIRLEGLRLLHWSQLASLPPFGAFQG